MMLQIHIKLKAQLRDLLPAHQSNQFLSQEPKFSPPTNRPTTDSGPTSHREEKYTPNSGRNNR
eukprot:c19770_g1_i1 orf=1-186(-)